MFLHLRSLRSVRQHDHIIALCKKLKVDAKDMDDEEDAASKCDGCAQIWKT